MLSKLARICLLFTTVAAFGICAPTSLLAADGGCQFGELEMPLPGMSGCIDEIKLKSFAATLFNIAVGAIVLIGVILVVVGGYIYMTAGGDASRVGTAKSVIGGALLGIVIALTAYVVLETISPQFINLEEPPLNFSPAPNSSP